MRPEGYIRPRFLEEALEILSARGGEIHVLGGGTDLVIRMKDRMISPKILLDITALKELDYIVEDGDLIKIGALTTIEEIRESKLIKDYAWPLYEAACQFGSPQIRNRATIGGNIVNASPVGDTVPPLYVLDATYVLKRKGYERRVKAEEFQTGPGTSVIRLDELLVEVNFPKMDRNDRGFFLKLGQRKTLIISKVSAAGLIRIEDGVVKQARFALGAVAPKVIRTPKAESYIVGRKLDEDIIIETARIATEEARPITDLRSTEFYRREMVGAIIYRGLRRFLA